MIAQYNIYYIKAGHGYGTKSYYYFEDCPYGQKKQKAFRQLHHKFQGVHKHLACMAGAELKFPLYVEISYDDWWDYKHGYKVVDASGKVKTVPPAEPWACLHCGHEHSGIHYAKLKNCYACSEPKGSKPACIERPVHPIQGDMVQLYKFGRHVEEFTFVSMLVEETDNFYVIKDMYETVMKVEPSERGNMAHKIWKQVA